MNFLAFKRKKPEDFDYCGWERLINSRVIGRNGARDRKILKENLLDGITYEKIAENHGLSVRQVARIISDRKKQLYKK